METYILIPAYETPLLPECIESINNTVNDSNTQILVAYNSPGVGGLHGFPKTCNLLIRSALRDEGAKYIILCSKDVKIKTEGWLDIIKETLTSGGEVGLMGGQEELSDENGPYYLVPHDVYPFYRRSLEPGRESFEVVYPPFAFVAMTREVIERVGLLDEEFGQGYYEDYDYGIRAWLEGFKSIVDPRVIFRHRRGFTMGQIKGFYPTEQAKYHIEKWSWLVKDRSPHEILDDLKRRLIK